MRILDIDLDFFINGTCEPAPLGERPDGAHAAPWSETQMREFLEQRCGLNRAKPLPGAIFTTHDEALEHWQRIPEKPFHVTHIDAHSDLGIGKPGPAYVLESIITQPSEKRVDIAAQRSGKKLDEANYLLFALAYRWISSLDNVRSAYSRPDMPDFCHDGYIHLVSSVGRLIPALDRHEPRIPFRVYNTPEAFTAEAPYDFATLAISPRYLPAEAEHLANIFKDYIII